MYLGESALGLQAQLRECSRTVVVPFAKDVPYQRMPPSFSLPLLCDEELQDIVGH